MNPLDISNSFKDASLLGALGIEFTHVEIGYLEATMPVDQRTHQPFGVLHGGASAALAETLGSFGSHMMVSESGAIAVGIELNINHVGSKRQGVVTGKARIIHAGKSTHVWGIEIVDEEGKLIATSRLTVLIKASK